MAQIAVELHQMNIDEQAAADATEAARYAIWRFHAWMDNQGSYIEIEEKVARGELVPELPYKSPNPK